MALGIDTLGKLDDTIDPLAARNLALLKVLDVDGLAAVDLPFCSSLN